MKDLSSRELQLMLAAEANRAPSVHNVQPARWAFGPGGTIRLYGDDSRRLQAGDPTGHDHRVSMGAAFEGMKIALSRHGLALGEPDLSAHPDGALAVARVAPTSHVGALADPLAAWVSRRTAWRGKFAAAPPEQLRALRAAVGGFAGVQLIEGSTQIREIVRLGDEATLEFSLNPSYFAELFSWLRFSKKHPGWSRDGLNADAMALSAPERWAGRVLMRPRVFAWLARLGLAKALVAESPKGETSSALILFSAPQGEDPFVTGRTFYRLWLEICAAGFSLCPISALADSERASRVLRERFGVPSDRRLVNVLRVGISPRQANPALAPRLPAGELLRD